MESNYVVKLFGSGQQFNQIGSGEGTAISYQVILIKNVLWPGMFTIAK